MSSQTSSLPLHPAAPSGAVTYGTTRISGPVLTPPQLALACVGLVLLLWVAYRIGRVILRLVAGLVFLGLLGFGVWYLFSK
jgi:hypothetical protein